MTPRDRIDAGVYVARLLRQTVRDTGLLVTEAAMAAREEREGAGVTQFSGWAQAHEHADFLHGGVLDQCWLAVERLLGAAQDAVEGLIMLLSSKRAHRTALVSLERVASEAVMRICYMLDTAPPPERTALRMLTYQVDAIEGNRKAARSFGTMGEDDLARVEEAIAGLHEFLPRHDIRREHARNDPATTTVLELDGHRESMNFNATDAFARYLPGTPWHWNLSSGASHSRGWMLSSMVDISEEPALASYEDACLVVGLTLLEVALAQTASEFAGVDTSKFHQAVHLRRNAMTQWREPNRDGDPIVTYSEYRRRPGTEPRAPLILPLAFAPSEKPSRG